jgi:hypothetical protein
VLPSMLACLSTYLPAYLQLTFEFSLCLSRACLGKMFVNIAYIYWLKADRFSDPANQSPPNTATYTALAVLLQELGLAPRTKQPGQGPANITSRLRRLAQQRDQKSQDLGNRVVPTPANISMTTCQIQTGWSPHSERSFER